MIFYIFLSLILVLICLKFWLPKVTFGEPVLAIDFSTKTTLIEDDRVHDLHKESYPDLCREYVLWRVKHDGSCWNSVGITLLLYHMIEGSDKVFNNSIEYFKIILAKAHLNKSQRKIIKDFFAILKLMRKKMDHRYSLELRNYENVYRTLDQGFRILLAHQERQKDTPDHAFADEIEQPHTRGHMSNIRPMLSALGFSYAGIDCFTKDGTPVIKTSLEEVLESHEEQKLGDILHKMPPLFALGSMPGYADIAVKKCFAERVGSFAN